MKPELDSRARPQFRDAGFMRQAVLLRILSGVYMTIRIFGHPRCPDCASLRASIMANEGRIAFEGHDISQLEDLHAFMALRDKSPAFDRNSA